MVDNIIKTARDDNNEGETNNNTEKESATNADSLAKTLYLGR